MSETPNYLRHIERRRLVYRGRKRLEDELPADLLQLRRPTMLQSKLFHGAMRELRAWSEGVNVDSVDEKTRMLPTHGGVVLAGPVGRGKSLLLSTLLHYAVDELELPATYLNTGFIDRAVRSGWSNRHPEHEDEFDIMDRVRSAKVIAIDDVGGETGQHVVKFIRQVIDLCASEWRFLILSTNLADKTLWLHLGQDERELSRRRSYVVVEFTKNMPDLRKGIDAS